MKSRFFVMLNTYDGRILPLVDLENEVLLFDSREAASAAASRSTLGIAYGFTVYHKSERTS